MTKELNAKDVPQIAWEYWGLVSFCLDNPGLYGMDKRRSDCHERLCKYYNISTDISRLSAGRSGLCALIIF
jgi:hypothetical protein